MKDHRLPAIKVMQIKWLLMLLGNQKEVAHRTRVSTGLISQIVHRERYATISVAYFDLWADRCGPTRDLKERIVRNMHQDHTRGCWNWTGGLSRTGYALMSDAEHGDQRAARVAYRAFHGAIPRGFYVLHACDNRACVNPDHLYVGTQQDNMNDAVARGHRNRPVGDHSPTAKLTRTKVSAIRQRHLEGERAVLLALEYQVDRSTIHAVVSGRTWVPHEER